MAASLQELHQWYNEGKADGATHMVVVCDTYDHEDYPVYVRSAEEARAAVKRYNVSENMQRVMEVYDLKMPFSQQCEGLAMNF